MTLSVVVIDDDEDTVRLFSEFLEEHDVNVIGNGFDGVSAVKLLQMRDIVRQNPEANALDYVEKEDITIIKEYYERRKKLMNIK